MVYISNLRNIMYIYTSLYTPFLTSLSVIDSIMHLKIFRNHVQRFSTFTDHFQSSILKSKFHSFLDTQLDRITMVFMQFRKGNILGDQTKPIFFSNATLYFIKWFKDCEICKNHSNYYILQKWNIYCFKPEKPFVILCYTCVILSIREIKM